MLSESKVAGVAPGLAKDEVESATIVFTGLAVLAVNLAAASDAWQLRTVG